MTPASSRSTSRTRFETRVVAVGEQVAEFVRAGVLVLFKAGAPDELAEFSVLHEATVNEDGVEPGDVLELGDERYRVLAVGSVANQNLQALGHLVVKANGRIEPELPGDVCVELKPLLKPEVGDVIRIETAWET
jgi:glucitol/sorbitol PTS system EIIA component